MYSTRSKRLQFLRNYVDDAANRSEPKYIGNDTSAPLIQQDSSSVNSSPAPSMDPSLLEHLSDIINDPILDDTGESLRMLVQDNVTNNAAYHNIEPDTIINNGNDEDASASLVQQITAPLIQHDSSNANSSLVLLDPCLQEQFSEIINDTILDDTGESLGMLLQDNATKNAAIHNIEQDTIINNGNDEDASASLVQQITAPLIQHDSSNANSSPAPLDPCLQEQFSEIINDTILDDTDGEALGMLLQDNATKNAAIHNIEQDTIINIGNDEDAREDASAPLIQQDKIFADEASTSSGRLWNENFALMEDSDDSVRDKSYETESSDSSSEDEPILADLTFQKRKTKNDKLKNKKIKLKHTPYRPDSDDIDNNNKIGNSKRVQKGETRLVRNERKTKRNLGDQYLTKTKKIVPQRKCRDLQKCRLKCSKRLEDEVRKTIFKEYWSMGNFNRRVAYIAALVSTQEKETTRAKKPNKTHKNRSVSHRYHLRINGEMTKVCKKCFLLTFGESNKFLTNVIKKKESSLSGITLEDKRGKGVPYNKTSEEALDLVKNHVSSLPSYESHYCRKQTENKFLPSYYTLSRIYEEYKKWIPDTMTPVSRRIYEDVFRNMKIKIKNPKKDSCARCDKIYMQIKNTSDTVKKQTLENDLTKHQTDAEYAYEFKKKDIQEALNDKTKSVFTFDLQQCLPTPDIQTSVVFYKRQLWTFNLTIHRCEDKQVFCYMWDEATAGRGANQIASCLYKQLIDNLDPEIKILTLYSDTCAGQNKNSFLPIMYMLLMREIQSLDYIDHKFLEPGHTHMECDTDHSIIEKKKKKHEAPIEHPRDWMQLVRMCGKTKPFKVIEMKREIFFEFSALLKTYFINKKINEAGEQVLWRDIKWLRYSSDQFGIVQYKTTLKHEEPFKRIDFKRKSKIPIPNIIKPPLSYKGPVPINPKKKENLIELLPYIDKNFHSFYQNLCTKDNIPNTLPLSDEESSDE